MTRVMAAIILIAYTVFLLDLALLQFPIADPRPNWVPFHAIATDLRHGGWGFVVNFMGNIIAFLPMGILPPIIIGRSKTRWWQAVLLGLAISLTIETGQYVSGRRVPDIDDLILNTFGGLLGYAAFMAFRRPRTLGASRQSNR